MDLAAWFLLIGALLLSIGLTYPMFKRLPITSAMIYLAVGMVIGPMGLGLFHFNPLKESAFLELLTEIVVLISLFAAGVKMPVPVRFAYWRVPVRLAFVAMAVTVGLVTLFGYYLLDLPLGAAVLLGAVIAPTDPCLATDVQVRHPGDRDRLRFALTSEGGMNDGSAFPFVMLGLGLLGLHDLGEQGGKWLLGDVIWATAAAVGIGILAGSAAGRVVAAMQRERKPLGLLDDFIGLGLIAIVYGLSLLVDAWGFLAVFAAAVALRQTEMKLSQTPAGAPGKLHESAIEPAGSGSIVGNHRISDGSLIFKEHLERVSELVLVLLIGGTLFVNSWSWHAVGFAAFLFCFARPVSVYLALMGTGTPKRIRDLAAWFGVRGIGSLYYLMYAIQHGLPEDLSLELIHLTLVVVTLSIFVHGISVKPMIRRYGLGRAEQQAHGMARRLDPREPAPGALAPG